MQQWRLAFFLLAAPLILLGNTSCRAITYSFPPAETITFDSPISNNYSILFGLQSTSLKSEQAPFLDAIQKGLEGPSAFRAAYSVDGIPETGPYVSVDVASHVVFARPTSWATFRRSVHLFLSMMTTYAIPYYGETAGNTTAAWHSTSTLVITYTLYVDGVKKKAYPYRIDTKVFRWLLAPLVYPFLSSEWDIPFSGEKRAQGLLTSTARQFLRDAQRDGLL